MSLDIPFHTVKLAQRLSRNVWFGFVMMKDYALAIFKIGRFCFIFRLKLIDWRQYFSKLIVWSVDRNSKQIMPL